MSVGISWSYPPSLILLLQPHTLNSKGSPASLSALRDGQEVEPLSCGLWTLLSMMRQGNADIVLLSVSLSRGNDRMDTWWLGMVNESSNCQHLAQGLAQEKF